MAHASSWNRTTSANRPVDTHKRHGVVIDIPSVPGFFFIQICACMVHTGWIQKTSWRFWKGHLAQLETCVEEMLCGGTISSQKMLMKNQWSTPESGKLSQKKNPSDAEVNNVQIKVQCFKNQKSHFFQSADLC